MKKITKEELEVFLRKHKLWLIGDPDGERANLYGADLYRANLYGADLQGANLNGANLQGANLQGANLYGADLYGANLYGANLNGANLRCPIACPEEGSFIGFKKVGGYIIKLEIPAEAKRCSATSRKCRCEYAKVLSITNLDGSDSGLTDVVNNAYYHKTLYKVGEIVKPDSFDEDRWDECSHGIHFFITRQEAVDY